MVQRFFRGQLIYFVLALLVIGLYLQSAPPGPVPVSIERQSQGELLELWPKELERVELGTLLSRNPQLAVALLGLGSFAAVMGLGGIGLSLWMLATGRLRRFWRFRQAALPRWTWGELARILLLVLIIASLMPFVRLAVLLVLPRVAVDPHLWLTIGMLFLDGFVIVTILAFAAGKGLRMRQVLGRASGGLTASLAFGLRAYITAFPWLFLLLYAVVGLSRAAQFEPPVEPLQDLLFREQHPLILGLTTVLACVIGPIAEELLFRGVVYATLRHRTRRWVAMAASGAVFSLIHTNLIGFVPILCLGWLLAYLYERTGSLLVPMAVHMVHNAFLMSAALIFRQLMGFGG